MMRWFFGCVFFLAVLFLLLGTAPLRAATASGTPSGCDEHPWDRLKDAYRVQILAITDEYILLAVWYTKDQINPVFIRIEYNSQQRVSTINSGPAGRKSFTTIF